LAQVYRRPAGENRGKYYVPAVRCAKMSRYGTS